MSIDVLRGQRHQITLELELHAMELPTTGAGTKLSIPGRTELALTPDWLALREGPYV